MPLLFHGFAAPQALVLHTLRTFMATHVLELGRPSVAGPVFARVFGPQTGVQKNHFYRSLEGAKSLENLRGLRIAGGKAFGLYDVLDRKQSSLRINGQLLFSAV